MVQTVIGAMIIYYLGLEWWWWVILSIAAITDLSEIAANTMNGKLTVDRLNDIKYNIKSLKRLKERKDG